MASSKQAVKRLVQKDNKESKLSKLPGFLSKLFNLVNDAETDDFIHWAASGQSFVIVNPEEFAKLILPKFFKHNNITSFVRQLNMYGFQKMRNLKYGNLVNSTAIEPSEFCNANFVRDMPERLALVTRKKGEEKEGVMDMSEMVQEITSIKAKQAEIQRDLGNIQRENQQIWHQSVVLAEQNETQKETVAKILSFLASVFTTKDGEENETESGAKKRRLIEDSDLQQQIATLFNPNQKMYTTPFTEIEVPPITESQSSLLSTLVSPGPFNLPNSGAFTMPSQNLTSVQENMDTLDTQIFGLQGNVDAWETNAADELDFSTLFTTDKF